MLCGYESGLGVEIFLLIRWNVSMVVNGAQVPIYACTVSTGCPYSLSKPCKPFPILFKFNILTNSYNYEYNC